jgi:hypothetical protein
MNSQDVQQVIGLVPTSRAALRSALGAGTTAPTQGGLALRFEVPTGTLDDSVYDLFRPGDYILSCVRSVGGTDLAYITRKVVKPSPSGLCYHATAETSLPGILSSGLIFGRNVPGTAHRLGAYLDSRQYIHASLTAERATEFWYYDRLCNDQAGLVLEIDLNAARCVLLADPCSDDGIVHATRIAARHIRVAASLPSVADMQAFLRSQGWTCQETEITSTVSGICTGLPASISGYSLPGAWRKFYLGVRDGTLP